MTTRSTASKSAVRLLSTSFAGLALALLAPAAAGQSGNKAAAEALFQDGRALFEQGHFAEACPKLAQSQSIDPAMGTLLTLALCHEGEGKLASAWQEFTTVEGQARRAGRKDREQIAREHAAALRPRLSTLTVAVPPDVAATPGFQLRIDGAATDPGLFGVAFPVDGGEHRAEATAPGKQAYSSTLQVKTESDAARIDVPALEDVPVVATDPNATPTTTPEEPPAKRAANLRVPALITAGAGVVLLGVGGYLALDAKADYDEAAKQCTGDVCPPGPYEATDTARGQGTVATVLLAVGGAAVATGVVLWFLSPRPAKAAGAAGATLHAGVGPRGFVVKGSF